MRAEIEEEGASEFVDVEEVEEQVLEEEEGEEGEGGTASTSTSSDLDGATNGSSGTNDEDDAAQASAAALFAAGQPAGQPIVPSATEPIVPFPLDSAALSSATVAGPRVSDVAGDAMMARVSELHPSMILGILAATTDSAGTSVSVLSAGDDGAAASASTASAVAAELDSSLDNSSTDQAPAIEDQWLESPDLGSEDDGEGNGGVGDTGSGAGNVGNVENGAIATSTTITSSLLNISGMTSPSPVLPAAAGIENRGIPAMQPRVRLAPTGPAL
jgi:hypothetical protein